MAIKHRLKKLEKQQGPKKIVVLWEYEDGWRHHGKILSRQEIEQLQEEPNTLLIFCKYCIYV